MKSIVKHMEKKSNKPFPKIMQVSNPEGYQYLYLVCKEEKGYTMVLLYDPTGKETVGRVFKYIDYLTTSYNDWTGSITLVEE